MKATDYIASVLRKKGISAVFGVTGGAVVHLFDSAKKEGLECVFTHHEQSGAFAAGAFARLQGLGALFCTTGPGGTNALTGIAAAWLDSVPLICLGGQVRLSHMKPKNIRQQGAQELDIVSLMKPITKSAQTVKSLALLPKMLEESIEIATSKRPGPVYLEIPLDLQWQSITLPEASLQKDFPEVALEEEKMKQIFQRFNQAKKPLVLIGHGVRLAKAKYLIRAFLDKSEVPHITTWNAVDLVEGTSPLYLGCPGMFGTREANLAVQTCDFLLCIGTHLPIPITTGLFHKFATSAEIAMINIDDKELSSQRVEIKHKLLMDARVFLEKALPVIQPVKNWSWKSSCCRIRQLFSSSFLPKKEKGFMDAYQAVRIINSFLDKDTIVVIDGGGTIVQIGMQTLIAKENQRIIIDAGLCSMGSGLPHVIGSCKARPDAKVFCLVGEGSLMFNLQELQTLSDHKMNVVVFVFNNEGYLSIKHTQESFLKGVYLGSSKEGGISTPDLKKLASSFCIRYSLAAEEETFSEQLSIIKKEKGPHLCEVRISKEQSISPKIGFSKNQDGTASQNPIDKMEPFIFEKETREFLVNIKT